MVEDAKNDKVDAIIGKPDSANKVSGGSQTEENAIDIVPEPGELFGDPTDLDIAREDEPANINPKERYRRPLDSAVKAEEVEEDIPARFSHTALVLAGVTIVCFFGSILVFLVWHEYVGVKLAKSGEPMTQLGRATLGTAGALLGVAAVAFCLAEHRQVLDEKRYQAYLEARRKKQEGQAVEPKKETADKSVQVGRSMLRPFNSDDSL